MLRSFVRTFVSSGICLLFPLFLQAQALSFSVGTASAAPGQKSTGFSYNAGVDKYFFSTLLHPLRDERHFALLETSAIPTKARS